MLETLQEGCDWLNTNKYFAGLMIVLLNIGSKYNTIELSKSQQNFFKSDSNSPPQDVNTTEAIKNAPKIVISFFIILLL